MAKALHRGGRDHAPEGFDLGVLADSFGPVIRLLRNELITRIVAAFEPYELRTGGFSALALIAANPGCAQADIAREFGVDKSVVVALIDQLEQRGLAERGRSTSDRRRNTLTLTAKGEALLHEMDVLGRSVEAPIRAALTPQEASELIRLGRKAYSALIAADAPTEG